jgi:ABC-type phosphate transport system substrate-binding protein
MKKTMTGVLLSLTLCASGLSLAAEQGSFKIIVNASNAASSLSRAQISSMFLKRATTWNDGLAAAPVDQLRDSLVRGIFTNRVHNKPVAAINAYWNQQIYSGRGAPPPEMASDAEVIAFVKAQPGAIGYVSERARISDVKVLAIVEK